MGYLGDYIGQLQHLRAQRLLPRKSEQLPCQAGCTVRVVLDLLDIIIIAVTGRMAQQHQIAISEDRGQDIVEIMRHAAGKLTDRLHFGGLGDLPFKLRFLAIVLQAQQDSRIAQPADARNRQRNRLVRIAFQSDGDVTRHGLAAGVTPDRIGNGRFVLGNHQIAGIRRQSIRLYSSNTGKGIIGKKETPVPIDERKA